MSVHTLYRACVWLPIAIPAALIVAVNALGLSLAAGVVSEVLAYSLLYGGLPYAALAVWATWWIGGRAESEIRRLMFRAPFLMVALFVPSALAAGLLAGRVGPFAAVAVLGAIVTIPLGYAYVGLAVLLRNRFGPEERSA